MADNLKVQVSPSTAPTARFVAPVTILGRVEPTDRHCYRPGAAEVSPLTADIPYLEGL